MPPSHSANKGSGRGWRSPLNRGRSAANKPRSGELTEPASPPPGEFDANFIKLGLRVHRATV